MKQWEYRVIDSQEIAREGLFKDKSRSDIEAYLNELGSQGWDVVNVDWRELEGRMSFSGIAKREKP